MQVKFKKTHKDATMPTRARLGDAGYDLTAVYVGTEAATVPNRENKKKLDVIGSKLTIDTGIAVEIPEGYVGYLFPRGSIFKYHIEFANSVGVIDSNFRGSIKVVLNSDVLPSDLEHAKEAVYKTGDKVAQLIIMPIPDIEFVEVNELSETDRNDQMLGSSGK